MSASRLAPLIASGPEVTWSQLAAAIVALTPSQSPRDVDSYEGPTVIERPTKKGSK